MTKIDRYVLETAFVRTDTPSLQDCLNGLSNSHDLSATRRRDLASGLRRIGRALHMPLTQIPADPLWLQPRLAKVRPASLGLTPKSWSNALSDARAAMAVNGVLEKRFSHLNDLSPTWQPLWDSVRASQDPSLTPALGRFVRFLDRAGIHPANVDTSHLAKYRMALELNELRKCPENAMRQAGYGWNLAAKRLSDWPKQILTLENKSNRYALALSNFPESFQQAVECFTHSLAHPDPLNPYAPTAPLRPATIRHRRAQILRFATALSRSGLPVNAITSLSTLVDLNNLRAGLRWMIDRNGGSSSPSIADTATMLKALVKHHVTLPADQYQEVAELAGRLQIHQSGGLTDKNRARLRLFDDERTLRKLLTLPDRVFEETTAVSASRKSLLRQEAALAVALLLACPIRRKNLSELHLDRNIRHHKKDQVFLVFNSAEVKNRRSIEFELPASITKLLESHLHSRSHTLCPKGTRWLFPRRDGAAPMDPSTLSKKVSRLISKEVGIDMNLHLFRHLAAKIWLEANPGQYEALRRLLGHAELSSTLNAYVGFEAGTATRLFAELIDRKKEDT